MPEYATLAKHLRNHLEQWFAFVFDPRIEPTNGKAEQATTSRFKLTGSTTVSPYLIVDGASRTINFLTRVFGATEIRRFPDEHGKLMHTEVRIGDTVLMIAVGAEGRPPIPAHVHVYVENVDATFKLALEVGAAAVQEPTKKDDPDKRGGVKDAGGTTWWIATKVE